MPQSIRIDLEGSLPPGVTAKDFALRIIGDWGADGGLYASVEFGGSGVEALSIDARMALANMMAEFGAKSAFIAPDGRTRAYLEAALRRRQPTGAAGRRHAISPLAGRRRGVQRCLPL